MSSLTQSWFTHHSRETVPLTLLCIHRAANILNVKVRIRFTFYINHGKYYNATIKK